MTEASDVGSSDFVRFQDLPAELRQEIWKFALPQRVVELDIPLNRTRLAGCLPASLVRTSRRNASKPTIAQVCHEAREVVLKHGRLLNSMGVAPRQPDHWLIGASGRDWMHKAGILGLDWYGARAADQMVWCTPGVDSIHLNWGSEHNHCLDEFDKLPMDILRRCKTNFRELSVMFDMVHPLKHSHGMSAFEKRLCYFDSGEVYSAVLNIFFTHPSEHSLAASDLFERGESQIVTVSLLDADRIAAYAQFCKPTYRTTDQGLLEIVSDPARCRDLINKWTSEVTKLWIWSRYKRSEHGNIWPFKSSDTEQLFFWRWELFDQELDMQVAWVAMEVKRQPKFHPAVMFRLSTLR